MARGEGVIPQLFYQQDDIRPMGIGSWTGHQRLQQNIAQQQIHYQCNAHRQPVFSRFPGNQQAQCQQDPDPSRLPQHGDDRNDFIQQPAPQMILDPVQNRKIYGCNQALTSFS